MKLTWSKMSQYLNAGEPKTCAPHVRPEMIVVCDWTNYMYLWRSSLWCFFACGWLWPEYEPWPCEYCRVGDLTLMTTFLSLFEYASEVYTSPSGGRHRMVCMPELLEPPQIIWPPPQSYDSLNYYHSQDVVLPNYGHHNCTNLNILFNLIVNTELEY